MKTVERIMSYVAAAILFVMMLVTFVDVVGRQMNQPLRGSTEITGVCLMLVIFLMLPLVTLRRSHIRVDLFEPLFGKVMFGAQRVAVGLLGGVLFGLMAYRLWTLGLRSLRRGSVTIDLGIPEGYLLLTMCVFSAITAVAFVVAIVVRTRNDDDHVPHEELIDEGL